MHKTVNMPPTAMRDQSYQAGNANFFAMIDTAAADARCPGNVADG